MEDTTVTDAIKRGNPVVFFDVAIGGTPVGRIRFELFKHSSPRTVENFRQFCTGEFKRSGVPVGYKGCKFHRVIKDFCVQGGDFVRGDGTGKTSIYGEKFPDEPEGLRLRHVTAGLLSMANSGPDSNGCQFFITCAKCEWLDGKHVVFGRVLDDDSLLVVRKLEAVPVGPPNDRPSLDISILECGEL